MAPTSLDVNQCSIGGLDAWTSDAGNIHSTFLPVVQYHQLAERDRCFLSGRRGAGKSAIAIMSRESPAWDWHNIIQGDSTGYGTYFDLIGDLLSRRDAGLHVDIKRFITMLWKYVMPVIMIQTVVRFCREKENDSGDAGSLVAFLTEKDFLHRGIGSILLRVFNESVARIGGGHTSAAAVAYLQDEYNDPRFVRCLDLLPRILGNRKVLIIFDTLESYEIHTDPMKQGLRGIITAIIELLSDARLHQVGVRFFIPAEVYEDAAREIPAKVAGSTVFLKWASADLIAMLTRRYFVMLERTGLVTGRTREGLRELLDESESRDAHAAGRKALRKKFWYFHRFLPESVTNTRGIAEDTFAYLLRHTQRRPRELIFIMNHIVEEAFRRGELPTISQASVAHGLHREDTLQTLLKDTLAPYEGYVDSILDRARSAFHGQCRVLDGYQLRRFAMAMYDLGGGSRIEPEDLVKILMRSGLVGLIENPMERINRAGYCVASFEYLMQDYIAYNKEKMYYVHPLLGDGFKMAPHADYGVVYPRSVDDDWLEEDLGISAFTR